ncbi:hypothetical protein TrST_g601 [Triparma strigata]|uniref:Lupus La protein n=1 Tax=Triparma strigata TaxID=1606541 RepID=A0A9W7EMV9_9STRA|nr:hypothetical protein TrST_g601 [Triparma strigata]
MTDATDTAAPASVPTIEPAVHAKLVERIRFFFGDANFRNDQFMQNEAKSNDGYVEISSLLRFNSVKKLTTLPAHVAKAAEEVATVVVSKDGEAIRRKDPLPENYNANDRTICVVGLPTKDVAAKVEEAKEATEVKEVKEVKETEETKVEGEEEKTEKKEKKEKKAPQEYTVNIDAVKAAFGKFGEVALVRMRYNKSDAAKGIAKSALGSCFIEFGSVEIAKAAVEAKETVKVGEAECTYTAMNEWLAANSNKNKKNKGNNKKGGGDDAPSEKKEGVELVIVPIEHESNCVITLSGIPEGSDREAIKAAFADVEGGADVYVDYSRGETDGAVRFKKSFDGIKDVAEKLASGDIKIAEAAVAGAKLLEGEEEEKYWNDAAKAMAERKRKFNDRKGNGGGNRGGKKQRR